MRETGGTYYVGYDGHGPYEGLGGATGPYMFFSSKEKAEARIEEMKQSWRLVNGAYMRTLLFENNAHEHGRTQVTVRKGVKWSDLSPGEQVCLKSVGGEGIVVATVQFIYKCPFYDIPQRLLDMEHDPLCRTSEGLREEMDRVYDDPTWIVESVTVVGYIIPT